MSKKYKLTSNVDDGGVLTEKWLDDQLKAMKKKRNYELQPTYSHYPEMAVDMMLEMDIVPQFAIVSPTSLKKIKKYIANHTKLPSKKGE